MATKKQLTRSPEADKRKIINQKQFNQLTDLLVSIDKRDKMKDFLKLIFTTRESRDISQRLEIIKLLNQGLTYEGIRFQLGGTGITTIAKISQKFDQCKNNIKKIF